MSLYYILIAVCLVLTWDVNRCEGRSSDLEVDLTLNLIDQEKPVLRGDKTSIAKADWKKMYRLLEIFQANKKMANRKREEERMKKQGKTTTTTATFVPTGKPLYGTDQQRGLDHLHDQTGDDQPMYHSALDGWIF